MSRWHSVMWRSRIAMAEQYRQKNFVSSVVPVGAAMGFSPHDQQSIFKIGNEFSSRDTEKINGNLVGF
jgi:hypothetical protein